MKNLIKSLNNKVSLHNLLDPEILSLSQKVDEEIVKYYKRKTMINSRVNKKI